MAQRIVKPAREGITDAHQLVAAAVTEGKMPSAVACTFVFLAQFTSARRSHWYPVAAIIEWRPSCGHRAA